MKQELEIKKIEFIQRIDMLKSLIRNDMYYECILICELFKDNINHEEKAIYNDVIKMCKTTQNKKDILKIIQKASLV